MEFVANFELNNNNLDASFDLSEGASFDALFEIYASGTTWGSIDGDIANQTDLYNILMSKADKTTVEADLEAINDTITENYETLDNKIDSVQSDLSGDISDLQTTVSDNYSELNTKIQNEAATRTESDNLLQGNINTLSDNLTAEISNRESADSGLQTQITNLTGTVSSNYNTLNNSISNLSDTVDDLSDTVDSNYNILDTKIDTTQTTLQGNINTLSGTVTSNYNDLTQSITNNVSTLNTRITNEVTTLNGAISDEAAARANADNNLQTQIDAIVSSSDVFDIVGTYAELQAYDISTVPVNDIVKVLVDSTHNNAATYYRCVENNGVKSWSYIGSEGAYYTKGEADSTFVPQTRTINNKALNQNINITASDVGALPVGTQIGNGTILLTQGGVQKGTFTLNQTGNATIDFDAVSEDITVDSELSTTSENPVQNKVITGALNDKQDVLIAGTDLEIVSVGSQGLPNGYTLLEWVESSGLQSLSLGFSGNCTIEFTVQMAHVPTSNEVLLTSSPYANAGTWFGITSDNTWAYCDISGTTKIDVVMNATSQGLNGTINGNAFSRNVPVTHGTWTLFSNIPGSGSTTFPSFMKLFALKATQNGVVIRNLIPCKNNNNVAGLYDTINSVFYFSTSGTQLIAGTVIPMGKVINFTNESGYTKNRGTVTSVNGVQPDANGNVIIVAGGVTDVEVNGESVLSGTVAEIDLTGYQEKLTAGTDLEIVEGSTLPAGYVQLTSITSTGTQYINTGIKVTSSFKSVIVGRLTDTPSGTFQTILGAMNQNTSTGQQNVILGFGNTTKGFYTEPCYAYPYTSYVYSSYPWDTNTHTFTTTITPSTTTLDIDGTTNTISSPPNITNVNLGLFARILQDNTVRAFVNFELNSIKLYQSGALVFNGIPCKLGDIVGLYNTVTNEFLPNSGTGAFIEGDVVPNETIINFTNESGYITGIDSNDVTTALGYTPYNASNPNGYTSNVGTVTSVNGVSPTNGNVAITIPTVNNGTLTITQDGNTLGTFGANQSVNSTIDIPVSGSSHWKQGSAGLALAVASNDNSEVVDILYNNNYIAITEEGGVYTSADGVTWNYDHAMVSYEQLDGYFWKSICYGNGIYLAMNQAGYYSTSTDVSTLGSNVMTTPTASLKWVSVAFGKGKFVALKNNGSIKTSTDGIAWTTATSVANLGNNNWQSIIFGGDKFIALSENGYISTSTDGTTWTVATQNNNLGANSWRDLSYNGGQYIAVSHTGYYSTSTDSTIWTVATQIGTRTTDSVTYANNKFLVATTGGALRWLVLSAQDLLYTKADVDGSNINQSFSTNLVANMSDTANIYMSGMGMPSGKYINLTLGASNSTYTAPADGYFVILMNAVNNTTMTVGMASGVSRVGFTTVIPANNNLQGNNFGGFIPVKKGDTASVFYSGTTSAFRFRFVYAVGSESEAS